MKQKLKNVYEELHKHPEYTKDVDSCSLEEMNNYSLFCNIYKKHFDVFPQFDETLKYLSEVDNYE